MFNNEMIDPVIDIVKGKSQEYLLKSLFFKLAHVLYKQHLTKKTEWVGLSAIQQE